MGKEEVPGLYFPSTVALELLDVVLELLELGIKSHGDGY